MANNNSSLKRIRRYCVEVCMCGSQHEVKLCPITECPLYDFRFGRNIFRTKRVLTDEQKSAMAERLKKAREAKSSK